MKPTMLTTILVVMLTALWPAAGHTQTIRLANGEWAPYLSEHLVHHGAASHIVTEAFAAVGVTVEYGFFPWKRAYKLAKEGLWHGTPVWVYTAERAKDFLYSDVVVEDAEYLFHLKSFDLRWSTVDDLKGLTIGATLHTVYPSFEKAQERGLLTIQRAGNYANLYRRLIKGRIDAIPNVKQVGRFLMRVTLSHEERRSITHSPTVIQHRRYHLILSKNNSENKRLIVQFNKGLGIIRHNGRYAKIIEALEEGFYDEDKRTRAQP